MNENNCWYKKTCKETVCNEYCIRYNCMKSLFEQSNVPEYMWEEKTLFCGKNDEDAFKQLYAILDNIKLFVETGRNVYIYSQICGNGKTSWSIKLLTGYFKSIWHKAGFNCRGLFINVPQFLYNCKRSISQNVEGFDELCRQIETCDIVIWDDLPTSEFTSYEHQIVLQYIDGRINSGKSNIFTGNCGKDDCYRLMGDRLASRLYGCSEVVELREGDKRGAGNG